MYPRVVCLSILIISLSCIDEPHKPIQESVEEPCKDLDALYTQVFSELACKGNYLLLEEALPFCADNTQSPSPEEVIELLISQDSIPNTTYLPYDQVRSVTIQGNIQYISQVEIDSLFSDPIILGGSKDGYQEMQRKYNSDGYIAISRPLIDDSCSHLLLSTRVQCGWKCSQQCIRYYMKRNDAWHAEMKWILSES